MPATAFEHDTSGRATVATSSWSPEGVVRNATANTAC
jgi:hypothetical protein